MAVSLCGSLSVAAWTRILYLITSIDHRKVAAAVDMVIVWWWLMWWGVGVGVIIVNVVLLRLINRSGYKGEYLLFLLL